MTTLAAWKTLQDLVDQFKQVVVKEKGKLLEAWIWSQIQSLTKKLDALWLRNSKGLQRKRKDCCHEPKKDDPSNPNSVAAKRKLDLNSAGECDIKEKHKVKRKRQHGVVENIGEKFSFFQRDLDSQTERET